LDEVNGWWPGGGSANQFSVCSKTPIQRKLDPVARAFYKTEGRTLLLCTNVACRKPGNIYLEATTTSKTPITG
jgi:hypothetical protein